MSRPFTFKVNQEIWRFKVLEILPPEIKGEGKRLRLQCVCGNEVIRAAAPVKQGMFKSCGCWQKETRKENMAKLRPTQIGKNHPKYKHGGTGMLELQSYLHMIARCTNPDSDSWNLYGGRGIKVCDRWLDSEKGFENFLMDKGFKPSPDYSIDRYPDKNGDYTPENTRWATDEQQARNRNNNRLVLFRGKERCLSEIAEILGVAPHRIRSAVEAGKDLEEVFS